MYENPNPRKDGEKQPLHARIVSKRTVRTQEIAEDIADVCGYSTGVTKGMLDALDHIVSRHLKRGYTVELDELGSFSISLKCRPVMDKKEIRSWSISFGNIHFRGNKRLKDRLKSIDLERAEEEASSTSFLPAQRKKRALNYLKENDVYQSLAIHRNEWLQCFHRSCRPEGANGEGTTNLNISYSN